MVNQDTTQANRRLTTFFSNPWIGLMGSIASIVDLLLAIFFSVQGKQERQLIFFVNPIRAVVVKLGQASRLSASFDNKVVKSDITASQIAIWNQGRLSIRKANILKPVVIYNENNIPILEATIRKTSREVVQPTLNTDDLMSGKVTVSWNIFEDNDGGIIQLIYADDPSHKLLIDGVVEGQNKIRQLKFSGKIKSTYEQYTSNKRDKLYSVILLLVFSISWLFVLFYSKIKRRRFRKKLESRLKELENRDKSELSFNEIRELDASWFDSLI